MRFDIECLTEERRTLAYRHRCAIVYARLRFRQSTEHTRQLVGWGAHSDPDIAHAIAVSELVERYAASCVPWKLLEFARLSAGRRRRIDPRRLRPIAGWRAAKLHLAPFRPESSYYWTLARDVVTGKRAQILADFCYYPFRPPLYPQRFAWANSSGMAAGLTSQDAERAAVLELFERDAFMVTWMARHRPPRIADRALPDEAKETRAALRTLGYTGVSLDLTCRKVPVAMALVYRRQWPALVVGLAARATLHDALIAAWRELEVGVVSRIFSREGDRSSPQLFPEDVVGAEDHGTFYNHPAHLHHAAFLWSSRQYTERDPSTTAPGLGSAGPFNFQGFCRAHQLDALYTVHYGAFHGRQVLRLLCPNLVPLTFGTHQYPLAHPARRTSTLTRRGQSLEVDHAIPHPLD